MDVFSDILALQLLSEDPRHVEGVHRVRWHPHLVDEELTFSAAGDLLQPAVLPIFVYVELGEVVIFRYELRVSAAGHDLIVQLC